MKRFAVGLIVVMVPAVVSADRKSFGYTYEYATLPEGQTELEIWHTQSRDTWDKSTPERFEEKLEIEHGITDNWDASMYTVLTQVAASDPAIAEPLSLDAIRLETRYRFADRGQWPVDTVAYFEVAKDFGKSLYELEAKGIFARDFDRVTCALNVIGEVAVGRDVPEAELELGWAAGATYELVPKVKFGVETWGRHEAGQTGWAVGPALSLAPSGRFWLVATAGFGVADHVDSDDFSGASFSGRIIMGLEL
jgi:hypothetical protein